MVCQRPFRFREDMAAVYDFMVEIYERDWSNGVPAPFFEYAFYSDWQDKRFVHQYRIWEDDGRMVAFCFAESPVTNTFFSLRPGYEYLAEEMISYAQQKMPGAGTEEHTLILFAGQNALAEAAQRAGWHMEHEAQDYQYDFVKPLDYPLPEGFRFAANPLDVSKVLECCWKGFGHEADNGPWDGNIQSALELMQAPHGSTAYEVAIENEQGDYVCYAGMWWVPENHLAYMEPLCTVPAYQRKGLGAAVLSELYRRMKSLGATHMTGGMNPFYQRIGYEPAHRWQFWKK